MKYNFAFLTHKRIRYGCELYENLNISIFYATSDRCVYKSLDISVKHRNKISTEPIVAASYLFNTPKK